MSQEFTSQSVDGRIGEGWGGDGVTGVHINLVIGRIGSATAAAASLALASPRPGHVPFLACAGAGTVIRPATVIVNKTTLDHPNLERATWGAGQLGIAQGVLDAVAGGSLPASASSELVLLVAASFDPTLRAVDLHAEAQTAIRVAARAAMATAISDALSPASTQSVEALAARRDDITNVFYNGH
jgi:5,6,7,8-tetrahydromethanopterin hydro-lyase